jgi:hypothetical protein
VVYVRHKHVQIDFFMWSLRQVFVGVMISDEFSGVGFVASKNLLRDVCGVKCPFLKSVNRMRCSFGRDPISLALTLSYRTLKRILIDWLSAERALHHVDVLLMATTGKIKSGETL